MHLEIVLDLFCTFGVSSFGNAGVYSVLSTENKNGNSQPHKINVS